MIGTFVLCFFAAIGVGTTVVLGLVALIWWADTRRPVQ